MKTHLIAPCLALSSPVGFLATGVLFSCGAPAGAALAIGFGGCVLAAWRLLNRFDRR